MKQYTLLAVFTPVYTWFHSRSSCFVAFIRNSHNSNVVLGSPLFLVFNSKIYLFSNLLKVSPGDFKNKLSEPRGEETAPLSKQSPLLTPRHFCFWMLMAAWMLIKALSQHALNYRPIHTGCCGAPSTKPKQMWIFPWLTSSDVVRCCACCAHLNSSHC